LALVVVKSNFDKNPRLETVVGFLFDPRPLVPRVFGAASHNRRKAQMKSKIKSEIESRPLRGFFD
jgi:hypothetical protein